MYFADVNFLAHREPRNRVRSEQAARQQRIFIAQSERLLHAVRFLTMFIGSAKTKREISSVVTLMMSFLRLMRERKEFIEEAHEFGTRELKF